MQYQIFEIDNPAKFCDDPRMANRNYETHSFEDVGRRLSLVRRALRLSQVEIADRLNIGFTRWNNWELGINQIPPSEALRLKRMLPGLSTDWIYDEDRSRLTLEAADMLDAAASIPDEPVKKRGRPRKQR